MSTFIELTVCIKPLVWQKRILNMDNCIAIKEHDATEQFKKRPVKEPFASQPLVCLLTMVYPDGSVEKLWVHASKHSIVTAIGYANHADNFTPPADMAAIEREWEQKRKDSAPTVNKFNWKFPAR